MNSWEYLLYIYEPNSRFFIFLVVNNYISFIEMKNLLGLNCQYVSQNTKTNFVVVTGGCLLHTLHYLRGTAGRGGPRLGTDRGLIQFFLQPS